MTLTWFWRHNDVIGHMTSAEHYNCVSGFLMTSSLLKGSIMAQMDIDFCILLFYIFFRNVMAFEKELAILHGFFNLRISKNATFLEKSPNGTQNIFFFEFLCLILYQNAYIFVQNWKFYVLNQSKYTFSPAQIYPWKLENWSFFSVFDNFITQSRDLGGSFLVC